MEKLDTMITKRDVIIATVMFVAGGAYLFCKGVSGLIKRSS